MDTLDEKFERKLKEKRDIENARVLSEISLHIKDSDKTSSKLLEVIDKQTKELSLILKKELPSPKVIEEDNAKNILVVLKKIEEAQSKIIKNQESILISQQKKPKRLEIVRSNLNNTIDYIDIEWNN